MDAKDFKTTHRLRNGAEITLRAIRPDDEGKLLAAFRQLDPASIYTRFFGIKKDLSAAELKSATNVDFDNVVALVATIGRDESETIIGGGRYVAGAALPGPRSAEVAFTIEEDHQGKGIAGLILKELAEIARSKGLQQLEATVLPRNAPMLAVFRRSDLPMTSRMEDGVVHIILDLPPDRA